MSFSESNQKILDSLLAIMSWLVKNPPVMQETQVPCLDQEDPWRRECLPTPVFLPGEFHRQRSLAGYSSWGHKETDTTYQPIL